jgi:hypothetical protein
MKLNIPLTKRLKQLFCKHETVGWVAYTEGINNKEGYELVNYECIHCGLSINEWFEKGVWDKYDFPDEYTIQNVRKI